MVPQPEKALRAADRRGALLVSLPKWIALAVIAWQARLAIEAMAGQGAMASLLTRFDRQTTSWELVCWVAGGAGVLYGLYSRFVLHRLRTRDQAPRGAR